MKDNFVYYERSTCRLCNSTDLVEVLDLGLHKLPWFGSDDIPKAPIRLVRCGHCDFAQLKHTVNPDLLYRQYWYKSGINQTMRYHLRDLVKDSVRIARPETGDVVIDIGANDGTLLSYYGPDLYRIAFEPAENLDSSRWCDEVHRDFFNAASLRSVKAKIITAIAMFYDLDDPRTFLRDIKTSLRHDGVFVCQMNYLGTMLRDKAFDNIGHEHLGYYSFRVLQNLFDDEGLEIFAYSLNDINGGSIRVYATHKTGMTKSIEGPALDRDIDFDAFAADIEYLKNTTLNILHDLVSSGKKVYGYGASTRGQTLLQYYGIGPDLLEGIAERNPEKFGLTTTTGIPIVPEADARDEADYLFVLPWHFKEEFIERERAFIESGGAMIFPLPELQIIDSDV